MYQEKYDEFQQTLTKSNDVFQNFKNEMDKVFNSSLWMSCACILAYCCKVNLVGTLMYQGPS